MQRGAVGPPSRTCLGAVELFAEARSYWELTTPGMVDETIQATLHLYVEGIARAAHQTLVSQLGVHGEDAKERCADLLAEPETTR